MKTNTKMAKVSKTVQGALDFARALGETQFSGERLARRFLPTRRHAVVTVGVSGKTCGSKLYGTLIQVTAEIQLDRASLTGGVLPVKDEGYSSRFP